MTGIELFFLNLFITAITYILRPQPKNNSKAPTESDVDFPTSDEASKIPVIFGSCLVENPSVFWKGDFNAIPIKKQKQTVAYKVYIGLAHALCFGDAKLHSIYFNDRKALEFKEFDINGNSKNVTVGAGIYNIDKPYLFSEQNSDIENGVKGSVQFYQGDYNQIFNQYISQIENLEEYNDYKSLCYVVYGITGSFYFGNNTTLPKISYYLQRFPSNLGLDETYTNLDGDANPAEIFYDILTDREKYGVSVKKEDIDISSFIFAAQKFKEENLGLSLVFNQGTFDDIKQEIEKHCACIFYVDTTTSKWSVRLLRDDYIKENLKLFDESYIESFSEFQKPQINELYNEVKVVFKDKNNFFKKRTARAYNNAMLFNRNFNNTNNIDMLACTNAVTAQKIAQRELNISSKPLISCKVYVNRFAYDLNIGDLIRVTYSDYNINDVVFRIREIKVGTFDSNKVLLTLSEDYFQYGYSLFDAIENSKDQNITNDNYPVIQKLIMEAPLYFSRQNPEYISANDLTDDTLMLAYTAKSVFNRILVAKDTLYTPPFAEISYSAGSETFYSEVKSSVTRFATTINIKNELNNQNLLNLLEQKSKLDIKENNDNLIYIVDNINQKYEFVAYENIEYDGNGGYNLLNCYRGLHDTVPTAFDVNAKVFILEGYINEEFRIVDQQTGLLEGVKINTYEKFIFTNEESAIDTINGIQTGVRNTLPIVCKGLKANGVLASNVILGIFEYVTLTWQNINIADGKNFYFYDDVTGSTLESDCTYSVRVYDEQNVLIKSEDGITGNNWTYDDEPVDGSGYLHTYLKIVIYKVNNTTLKESFVKNEIIIIRDLP